VLLNAFWWLRFHEYKRPGPVHPRSRALCSPEEIGRKSKEPGGYMCAVTPGSWSQAIELGQGLACALNNSRLQLTFQRKSPPFNPGSARYLAWWLGRADHALPSLPPFSPDQTPANAIHGRRTDQSSSVNERAPVPPSPGGRYKHRDFGNHSALHALLH